jgi:hypothetical protein
MVEWLKRRSGRVALTLMVTVIAAGLAISFPPDIAFLLAICVGTWVEAAVAVYVAAQITRVRPLLTFMKAKVSARVRRSARQTRTASQRRDSSSNDDEPASALSSRHAFDFRASPPHLRSMTSESFRRFTVHSGQIPARA